MRCRHDGGRMALNPFEFVKALNEKRDVGDSSLYTPFLSNRAFSYHLDTILIANEMNKYPDLPPEVQYAFMDQYIRKGKRFSSWYKEDNPPNLELVMEFFNCSKQKGLQALQVLTQDQLRQMKERMDKGGR